jgi:peptidoglycan/LPS O-acetylase OafA/YrhL
MSGTGIDSKVPGDDEVLVSAVKVPSDDRIEAGCQPAGPAAGNWRPTDTNLLRAVAAILISNSHLEPLYKPRSWMAGDGLLGMLMFFFLSGFGISLASRSRVKGFFPWMGRRIMRIYPAVILSILIVQFGIYGQWRTMTLSAYPAVLI